MKNKMKFSRYFIYLILVMIAPSCKDYFFNEFTISPTDNSNSFVQLYGTEEDFIKDSPLVLDATANVGNEEVQILWDVHYETWSTTKKTLFIDARTPDGKSTWSSPKMILDYEYGQKYESQIKDKNNNPVDHKHLYEGSLSITSSPVYLHLCLNQWNENPINEIPGKTWVMKSVEDVNGNSLANDPDWTYYTDNLMRFEKVSKFIYVPGTKRSQIELDLFGTEAEHKTLKGSYIITTNSSGKAMITLSFPDFTREMEVVESSWTSLTLKGTSNGKTGIMKLEPDPQHDDHDYFVN